MKAICVPFRLERKLLFCYKKYLFLPSYVTIKKAKQ